MEKERKKAITIDFDETICQKQNYSDGAIWQVPIEGAVEAIQELDKKYRIIIQTVRLNPFMPGDVEAKRKEIEAWLTKYSIPFYKVTNNKYKSVAYVDDKGIRFTTWPDVMHLLQKFLK
jgi:histidinol phosphatase-like enzyme